jgi:acetyl esterase
MTTSYQRFLPVFLSSVLYLTSYFFEYQGDLDFASFYQAKVTHILFPETFPKNESGDILKWRDVFASQNANISTFDIGITEVRTNVYGSPGQQLMRIYNSNLTANTGHNNTERRDVLLWFHDGSWMFGGAEYDDEICYKLAKQTGFVVVSADYRLAPEHPFPQPMIDATKALQWVKDNIERYGAHPKRIMLGGEGAGGNLAAAVALNNLDMKVVDVEDRVSVVGLLLVYPPLAMTSDGDENSSYVEHGDLNGLMTAAHLDWDKAMYRSTATIKPAEYRFAPLVASPHLLKLLPNTVLVLAKNCILYDEGMKFSKILKSRYVPVETLVYNSTIYGFFGRSFFPQGDVALNQASEKLRDIAALYPDAYFADDDDLGGELPPFPSQGIN